MRKFLVLSFILAGAVTALSILSSPASAQASRTWVSGVGDDVNPCSRTAPCKTFAGAISKTAVNGEINCLDPGGFGAVTITKSITLDCHGTIGSILSAGTDGINIAFDSFAAADTRKTVNLRGLMIQGFDTGIIGIRILGDGTGSAVNIEDSLVNGNFGSTATGIADQRKNGKLSVINTTVRNMGANGISISSAAGGLLNASIANTAVFNSGQGGIQVKPAGTAKVSLSGVQANGNGFGIGIDTTGGGTASVFINYTTVSENTGNGVQITGASSEMLLSNSTLSHNATGVNITSPASALTLKNNVIYSNVNVVGNLLPYPFE